MNLQRIGLKFFLESGDPPAPARLISVFHAWIQQQILPDHLLVDVHDYSHIHQGPGILLVAHEGHFSLDQEEGLPGLLYSRKQPQTGSLPRRLEGVFRAALTACRRLEEENGLERLGFKTDRVLLTATDRLNAPAVRETFDVIQPSLKEVLERLLEPGGFRLVPHLGSRERLAVTIENDRPSDVRSLLRRLEEQAS